MFEYYIMNRITKERDFIYGYSWQNAMSRNPWMIEGDWICLSTSYVD